MKACKVNIVLNLLLDLIGLEDAKGIEAYRADVDKDSNAITLYLTGDVESLPDVNNLDEVPQAIIIARRIESRIEVIPPIK